MARVDLFEISLSEETLKTLKLTLESGSDAFLSYQQFCADILDRSTELAYLSARSKVPVRSQSLRNHIRAHVSRDFKGYVYIEDGSHARTEDHDSSIGTLRFGRYEPHVETGRKGPTSQRAVQHFNKRQQKTSRALKQSELAFLLDTGGYSLKRGSVHKQTAANRNTSGIKLKSQLASHDLAAFVDSNKNKTRKNEDRYRPDTGRTDHTDLQDIIKDYFFARAGVAISPLKPPSGRSGRKRQHDRKSKQVEDPRIKLVEHALTKEYPKQQERKKKVKAKLDTIPRTPANEDQIIRLEAEFKRLDTSYINDVYDLVKEATIKSYGRQLEKGKGFRRSIGTVIKKAGIEHQTGDTYALEALRFTVGNLPQVEKRVNALARTYSHGQRPNDNRKFEADKKARIKDYEAAHKKATAELDRLKKQGGPKPSASHLPARGPEKEQQRLREHEGRIAQLTGQLDTYKKAIAKAQSATNTHNLPKEWVRSKDSVPADPFKGISKGSHTKNWIADAQADFQNHLKSNEDYREVLSRRPNERLVVRGAALTGLSAASLLGTQSIHSKKPQFNEKVHKVSAYELREQAKSPEQKRLESEARNKADLARNQKIDATNKAIDRGIQERAKNFANKNTVARLARENKGAKVTKTKSGEFIAKSRRTNTPPPPPTPEVFQTKAQAEAIKADAARIRRFLSQQQDIKSKRIQPRITRPPNQ